MRTVRVSVGYLAIVLGMAVSARAQDSPKTGLVFGYPTALGILWPAGDKVAIRPEFSVSGSTSEATSASFSSNNHTWAVGVGLSALFYLHSQDHLRTYFVPRFSYNHLSATSKNSSSTNPSITVPANVYGGSGSFGAQYTLGDRFGVFGELGFAFDHQSSKTTSGTKVTGNNWGMRAGVGVIFYP